MARKHAQADDSRSCVTTESCRAASWDEALDRAAAGFRKALDEGAHDRALQLLQGDERAELRHAEVRPGRPALQQRRQLQPNLTRP